MLPVRLQRRHAPVNLSRCPTRVHFFFVMCCAGGQGTFRTYWDSVSMLFIIYVVVFTPMQVGEGGLGAGVGVLDGD